MREKKWNSSCDGERGGTEEMKAVRSRLMWETCLPPRVMVMSRPSQLSRAISGSVVPPQVRVYMDIRGPCYHQMSSV